MQVLFTGRSKELFYLKEVFLALNVFLPPSAPELRGQKRFSFQPVFSFAVFTFSGFVCEEAALGNILIIINPSC